MCMTINALPRVGLFERLSAPIIDRLLMTGERRSAPAGATLNEVGEPCAGLLFILSGQVRVDQMAPLGWVSIATLNVGDVVGAMEWLEGKVWEERVVAVEACELLFVSSGALRLLSASHPELQRQVERFNQRHTLHTLLGESELFQRLHHEDLLHLIDVASLRAFSAGARIFDPSVRISSLFVVGQGVVTLKLGERFVQHLKRGALLNVELALGADGPLLSAYAERDVSLYLIPFEEVELAFARAEALPSLQRLARQRRTRLS